MHIVHASSEIVPWSKAGGLGDVSGALPAALVARGHRVITVAPRYAPYEGAHDTGWRTRTWLYGQEHALAWYRLVRDGVEHLFVDHPSFHRDGIYSDVHGPFGDNLFRFALLSRATLHVPDLPLPGGPLDEAPVFHVNDWHTALVPVLLDGVYRPVGRHRAAATVLALHNVAHHGREDLAHFDALDLAPRWRAILTLTGRLDPLHGGVALADQLVTVSPTYAREITEDRGHGLEPLLRERRDDLHGIVNGVGPEWDPATDPRLPARFDASDPRGKVACKASLQERFGLPQEPDAPVVGFIGRLVHQKGIDLLAEVVPALVARGAQVVLLGSGQPEWGDWMRQTPARYPGRVGSFVGYDEDRAHLLTAGSDLLVMPSRFEPCGLNQLYALRYGTVPVVHATGGLVDTVIPYDAEEDTGTGFRFAPHTPGAFLAALEQALDLYQDDAEAWRRLARRGMVRRSDWGRAAAAYEDVYERARERRRALSAG